MHSISLILSYFLNGKGAWPEYIDWHLASCRANSTINFYIFTDDHSLEKWESTPNIHLVYMTFQECRELMRRQLGDIQIDTPYKMCDYKPCYGTIFYDWIKDCDYWGFYDCDLLFGNLRKYYTDELLDKYDSLMLLGHLQLFKNTEEARHFYCLKRPEDSKYKDLTWENIRVTTKYSGYDEWSGVPQLIRENGKKILWEREVFSNIYQPSIYKRVFDKNVSMNRPFQVWHWTSDGLYHVDMLTKKTTARLYIHLTQRKMKFDPYENQTEVYITQKSEFKAAASMRDAFTGWEFVKLFGKKVFIWIGWHLTHLTGKKSWEM